MKKNKIIEYTFSIIICIFSFFSLFVPNKDIRIWLVSVCLILVYFTSRKTMKYKKIDSINKFEVMKLLALLPIIYLMVIYVLGIFVGFYRNSNAGIFQDKILFFRILPCTLIIVLSEIIRQKCIIKQNTKAMILLTIGLVLAEISIFVTDYNIKYLSGALALFGFVILPAISSNILENYICKRYGCMPNIIYRLIMTMYLYIIPILPDIYMFFLSMAKFVYPYIIYMVIDKLFEKGNFKKSERERRISIISLAISLILITGVIMLISCKFRYGIIVTGSSSMSDKINKGDAVVFEQYKGEELEKGQVIIFYKDNIKTIHRIENIQTKNDQTIIYTKGDHNQQADDGYRIKSDIIGVAKFRIIYIGWPTLWVNNLFNK